MPAAHWPRLENRSIAGRRARDRILLLSNAMDRHKGIILIDTPGHNRSARTVAGAKGFRRMGATHRMYKGDLDNGHDQNIYGLACLELG